MLKRVQFTLSIEEARQVCNAWALLCGHALCTDDVVEEASIELLQELIVEDFQRARGSVVNEVTHMLEKVLTECKDSYEKGENAP